MLNPLYKLFITLFIVAALTSCGFTTHPNYVLPPELQNLTLTTNSPYSSFTRNLTETLTFAQVNLLPPGQAPFILHVTAVGPQYNSPLVVTSSQARIYRLTYQVSHELLDTQGHIIYPQKTIITSRDLILAPNQLLGTNNQTNTLTTEMQQESIYRIFSQLNSSDIKQAIDNYLAAKNKRKRKYTK